MKLTVKEAAAVLSRSERTVRAQLARGELFGSKVNGAWIIDSAELPLTEAQRERTLDRVARAHGLVERALPKRARRVLRDGGRSMRDFDPFRVAVELLSEARTRAELTSVAASLEAGLLQLGHAAHEYLSSARLDALRAARRHWCCAAAIAWSLEAESLAQRIERELVGSLGGILRYTERQVAERSDRSRR